MQGEWAASDGLRPARASEPLWLASRTTVRRCLAPRGGFKRPEGRRSRFCHDFSMTPFAPTHCPMSDEIVVQSRALSKVYRDFWGRQKVRALKGVDLEVRRGE